MPGCSRRSVEEALKATTPNGGCRDCQDDRYVRLLMQELQSRQAQQEQEHQDRMTCIRDSLEVTGGDFTGEGDVEDDQQEGRRSRPLQGMLSDNLAVDSVAFTNVIPSSLEDEEEGVSLTLDFCILSDFLSLDILSAFYGGLFNRFGQGSCNPQCNIYR